MGFYLNKKSCKIFKSSSLASQSCLLYSSSPYSFQLPSAWNTRPLHNVWPSKTPEHGVKRKEVIWPTPDSTAWKPELKLSRAPTFATWPGSGGGWSRSVKRAGSASTGNQPPQKQSTGVRDTQPLTRSQAVLTCTFTVGSSTTCTPTTPNVTFSLTKDSAKSKTMMKPPSSLYHYTYSVQ